jgi:ABC-type Fe3+/spermidine/putrescine transport system ATPase subunit
MKLEVREVSKQYAIPVLDRVSLRAEKGEFVCLLGPNGCGKTTLLRILGGLEPPTTGEVRLDGRPVEYGGGSDLHVGVVFQEDRLLPWMTLGTTSPWSSRRRGVTGPHVRTPRTGISASWV